MESSANLDRCLTFINSQMRPGGRDEHSKPPRLAITVSRQTGCGAWEIAPHLARILEQSGPPDEHAWTVFDRELVEKVLEDHNLPSKLARYMPEDKVSYFSDAVQELLGLHPPSWDIVRKTTDTIMRLAAIGRVILIGRGANVVTSRLRHTLHVRLVGSLGVRIKRLMDRKGLDEKEARRMIEQNDRGRERYLKEYFRAELGDPLLYDLTVNTDRFTSEQSAELIAVAALQRMGWQTAGQGGGS
jgi:cytidylate kinase